MNRTVRRCILSLAVSGGLVLPSSVLRAAQTPAAGPAVSRWSGADSTSSVTMREVTVVSSAGTPDRPSAAPTDRLDRTALEALPTGQAGDAAKFLSGATVKDYGGLGGMKTLSVRSMGAGHTAVSYDGVVLSDGQTGQVDLGRFSLENADLLSLALGDADGIFQTARAFSTSGLLSIRTRKPVFGPDRRIRFELSGSTGSFGAREVRLWSGLRLGNRHSLTLHLQGQHSDGNYPFLLAAGSAAPTASTAYRQHNRVDNFLAEAALSGLLKGGVRSELRGYAYASTRELPGAVILHNTSAGASLDDRSGFVQYHREKHRVQGWSWQWNAKLNGNRQHYLDENYLGADGREEHTYAQEEAYLSGTLMYRLPTGASFSWATDAALAAMQADLKDFADPKRYSLLSHLALQWVRPRWEATAGLLATGLAETTSFGEAAGTKRRLSPSVNFSVQPFAGLDRFRIRGFLKSTFRVPSFNDLYYSAVGNVSLRPENSRQADLGLLMQTPTSGRLGLRLAADAYLNRITDKIQAVPTRNMFIWSMTNLGRVDIAGADLSLEGRATLRRNLHFSAVWNHSYQRALDRTDSGSKTYGRQIAYAPRVYGSLRSQVHHKAWTLGYSCLYAGHRFVTGQNLVADELSGYADQALTLDHTLSLKFGRLLLRGECRNLADQSYEIVRNFPMPGRNVLFTTRLEF